MAWNRRWALDIAVDSELTEAPRELLGSSLFRSLCASSPSTHTPIEWRINAVGPLLTIECRSRVLDDGKLDESTGEMLVNVINCRVGVRKRMSRDQS